MKQREELEKLLDMSDEELESQADSIKESLFRLNFRKALGEVDAAKTIRRDKKTLARINTILRQREMQATK